MRALSVEEEEALAAALVRAPSRARGRLCGTRLRAAHPNSSNRSTMRIR